nr:WAT1-related protein At3g28050-like [Tanacetum cinerariifolium]
KKKESGSILEILEEMISVGQTMGFSMEGSIKDMERIIDLKGADDVETKAENVSDMEIKSLWGNTKFDAIVSQSLDNSRGLLCVWDPNSFKKDNHIILDNFIALFGKWRANQTRMLIVSVYAPQAVSLKCTLWSYLSSLINRWNGECIVLGDFNEVRRKEERWGSTFNVYGARDFNQFITDEIRRAVWDCGENKSPGLDGFTFEFKTDKSLLHLVGSQPMLQPSKSPFNGKPLKITSRVYNQQTYWRGNMAGDERYVCYKDVLPIATLVAMQCVTVGLNTLYKAATLQGMRYHVFMVYCYGVAAFILLPAPFFSYRSRGVPPVRFSIVSKIILLGIIGFVSMTTGLSGINYSSPTLASAISNLLPAFTFILAVTFRMETLSFSKNSTRAKLLGTIISITGAFVVTLYKGPKLIWSVSPLRSHSRAVSIGSLQDDCELGGLLSAENILLTYFYILQEYPAKLTVVFFYDLVVCNLSAIMACFTEPDSSAWKIKLDIVLVTILCAGAFGSCMNNSIHTWALNLKGPLFVAMFKPLSIAIAVVMGVLFLGDNLYLGSVIGAAIISTGFYMVMWGKAREDIIKDEVINLNSSLTPRLPLLQYNDEDMETTVCHHRESSPETRLLSETAATISIVLGSVTAILVAGICFCSSIYEVYKKC